MTNQVTIVCPHCKVEFPLTDALSHEYEVKAEEKIKKELELTMKDKTNEVEELKKTNKDLQNQFLELNKTIRELQRNNEIEMQKRLTQEGEKFLQEHKLKEAEKDKKITDLMKDLEDAQKKLQQGSQQTQGEVLELEFQNILHTEFPLDSISEIKKGVHGADILQVVVDKNNQECGKILWETKNGEWSGQWQAKLREDQRNSGAELAGLVCTNLPKDIKNFTYREGVWVSSFSASLSLAYALRFSLIHVNKVRMTVLSKGEKKDELYDYVTSVQFAHRVEAMMDSYNQFKEEIEKQKRYFATTWAKQEKSIMILMEQTGSIHGELAGIVGKALPDVRNLELEEQKGGEDR